MVRSLLSNEVVDIIKEVLNYLYFDGKVKDMYSLKLGRDSEKFFYSYNIQVSDGVLSICFIEDSSMVTIGCQACSGGSVDVLKGLAREINILGRFTPSEGIVTVVEVSMK